MVLGLLALSAVLLLRRDASPKPEPPSTMPPAEVAGASSEAKPHVDSIAPVPPAQTPAAEAENVIAATEPDPSQRVAEASPGANRPAVKAAATEDVSRTGALEVSHPMASVPAEQGTPLSTAEIVERCDPAIALIQGKWSSGTGFLVRPGVLATNAHVIDDEFITNLEARFPAAPDAKSGPWVVELLYEDPARDLAFLAVKSDLDPLTVASGFHFRKGEDITVIGSPGFGDDGSVLENAVTKGVLSVQTKKWTGTITTSSALSRSTLGIPADPSSIRRRAGDRHRDHLKAAKQEGVAFGIPVEDLNSALARLDAPNASDLAATRARHRMPLTFRLLTAAGVIQAGVIEATLVKAVDREKAREGLKRLDRTLFFGLRDEARRVAADTTHYPDPIRRGMTKIANSYLDLRTMADQVVESAPSNSAQVRSRLNELRKAHFQGVMELKSALKIEVPEGLLAALK